MKEAQGGSQEVMDKRKGRDLPTPLKRGVGVTSLDIAFQFPHAGLQASGYRAGTGSSPWKSLQWHFRKSRRKTSSSEGSSGFHPETLEFGACCNWAFRASS